MTRVLLTGGTVFDGHRHLGPAAVLVDDGRVAAVGEVAPAGAPAPRWSTSPAGWSRPASSTPTSTRSRAASSGCAAT